MCGIAGVLGSPDRAVVERMMQAMQARGPDDSGLHLGPGIALGHRRLSILDLSAAGRQPMERHGIRVVYNGEIYNFRELRADLEARGHVFRTRTDTEVLLALYEEDGTECLRRLRGMFAFAIWDPRGPAPVLFLARDHFGIKPLVYAESPGGFVFASDLPGLLASGLVPDRIDRVALVQFLMHGHVVQPRTIFEGVRMLPPGHALAVSPGGSPRVWRYWDLDHARCAALSAGLDFGAQVERLRGLLDRAAAAQMVSDVPLGAFLSGGVDSSALVGLMTRSSGRPVHTFSVGFGGEGAELDESSSARRSAAHLGAIHTAVDVTGSDVAEALPRIVQGLGQPTIDGVNMYFVSQAARRGVKVALAGIGGDELFAGYPAARELARIWDGSGLPARRRIGMAIGRSGLWRALPPSPARERWELRALQRNLSSHYSILHSIRSPETAGRLAGAPEEVPAASTGYLAADDPGIADVIARVGRLDLRLYMGSQLLRDADAASMAHSLEVRVPFLDVEVAEFAWGLPGDSKLASGDPDGGIPGKRVLIEAVRDLLPDWTWKGPKRGFTLPFAAWLRGPLRDLAADMLADRGFGASGILDPAGIAEARRELLAGKVGRWPRVWSVLVLGFWWRGRQGTRASTSAGARSSPASIAVTG